MKKYVNGECFDMTTEEIADRKAEQTKWNLMEKSRPITTEEVTAMIIKQQINTLEVDDRTALRMIAFYPTWDYLAEKSYTAEKAGFKFVHSGKLYKTKQENYTFSSAWIPGEGTESIYERIDETHDGSKYDPIPYEGNMVIESGKYYVQEGVTYVCTRDTGNPVYHALKDLVGLYVDIVTE